MAHFPVRKRIITAAGFLTAHCARCTDAMDPRAGTTIGAKVAKVGGVKNALQTTISSVAISAKICSATSVFHPGSTHTQPFMPASNAKTRCAKDYEEDYTDVYGHHDMFWYLDLSPVVTI